MSYEDQATSFIGPVSPEEARALSRRARDGDKEASDRLALANAGLVFHPAMVRRYRRLAKWLPFQDATQEGWVAMAKAVKGYHPDAEYEFSSYAWKCLRNHLSNLYTSVRAASRDSTEKTLGTDEKGHRWIEQVADDTSAMEGVENREQVRVLLQAVWPRERDVLMLRFGLTTGSEATHKEIGEGLEITRERVRQLEGRGLTRIREQFGRAS